MRSLAFEILPNFYNSGTCFVPYARPAGLLSQIRRATVSTYATVWCGA
ncbi:hypothetical protein CAMGR0001_2041 [Campylobacter gracilis RM3268]|uniref:Uncharacterized protein n=1 Tax=Campylobacter gracilis RM3268 TaxID=553220 RepID=C8PLN1_9BACT|nr:hypothetical protein CAMGR0001_2041 [Campylobacter gracilis RM3268]